MNNFNPRRGGILLNLLLTAITLLALAIAAGIAVGRNIHVKTFRTRSGDNVSILTPAGSFQMRAQDHAGMSMIDIPPYPGARQKNSNGGGAEFSWTSSDGKEDKSITVAGAEMITADPAAKVFDYYHDKMPAWIVSHQRDGKIFLNEPKGDGAGRRFIGIQERADGTHIAVASIGAPAAN